MFVTDAISGAIRLFVLFVLPFMLIHAGFTRLAGGRIEGYRYANFCLCCIHTIFRAIWRGATVLADGVATALPRNYAPWKIAIKIVLRYIVVSVAVLALMTCMACFSHADYPLSGALHGL